VAPWIYKATIGIGTTVTVRFPAERIALAPDAAKAASDDNRKAG